MTRPSHAALVEEVAKAISVRDRDDRFDDEVAAGVLSLIAARLSDVTPEMVEVVAKGIHHQVLKRAKIDIPWSDLAASRRDDFRDDARAAISGFLAASALTAGDHK